MSHLLSHNLFFKSRYQLVNKQVQALYDYEGQSEGELSFMTGQLLIVISAESADWVTARNENGR